MPRAPRTEEPVSSALAKATPIPFHADDLVTGHWSPPDEATVEHEIAIFHQSLQNRRGQTDYRIVHSKFRPLLEAQLRSWQDPPDDKAIRSIVGPLSRADRKRFEAQRRAFRMLDHERGNHDRRHPFDTVRDVNALEEKFGPRAYLDLDTLEWMIRERIGARLDRRAIWHFEENVLRKRGILGSSPDPRASEYVIPDPSVVPESLEWLKRVIAAAGHHLYGAKKRDVRLMTVRGALDGLAKIHPELLDGRRGRIAEIVRRLHNGKPYTIKTTPRTIKKLICNMARPHQDSTFSA